MVETSISPKGTKFLIEIELTKDTDVIMSCIGRSLYSDDPTKQEIEGTFKITKLNILTEEKIKEKMIDAVTQAINQTAI